MTPLGIAFGVKLFSLRCEEPGEAGVGKEARGVESPLYGHLTAGSGPPLALFCCHSGPSLSELDGLAGLRLALLFPVEDLSAGSSTQRSLLRGAWGCPVSSTLLTPPGFSS